MVADLRIDPVDMPGQAIGRSFGQVEPQSRERGLEAVRQIGDMAACLLQRGAVGLDQPVQFLDQRQQFARLGRIDPRAAPGADVGHHRPDMRERSQPDAKLDQDRQRQPGSEQEERQEQRRHRRA